MKRKIKNFSDFLECIKTDKKVTDNDGKLFYYFENGCICCKDKEGFVWYNTYVDTNDLSRIEVEEQEHFTIEIGKFYRTRVGKKAYCFNIDDEEDRCEYKCQFAVDDLSETISTDFCGNAADKEESFDIVGYWDKN